MGKCTERHCTPHDLHRGLAHKTCRKDDGMNSQPFKFPGHLKAFSPLHPPPETIMHVHLDNHTHVISSFFHHPSYYHLHKPHPVFQRTAEEVMAMVGVRRKELADQVAVTGMDLDTIEPGPTGKSHRPAEVFHKGFDLINPEFAHEGWRIQIETSRSAYRHAATGRAMSHVTAVSQLDRDLGSLFMDCIRNFLQGRNDLFPHPQLAVE